jgi:hypothetical protein
MADKQHSACMVTRNLEGKKMSTYEGSVSFHSTAVCCVCLRAWWRRQARRYGSGNTGMCVLCPTGQSSTPKNYQKTCKIWYLLLMQDSRQAILGRQCNHKVDLTSKYPKRVKANAPCSAAALATLLLALLLALLGLLLAYCRIQTTYTFNAKSKRISVRFPRAPCA